MDRQLDWKLTLLERENGYNRRGVVYDDWKNPTVRMDSRLLSFDEEDSRLLQIRLKSLDNGELWSQIAFDLSQHSIVAMATSVSESHSYNRLARQLTIKGWNLS